MENGFLSYAHLFERDIPVEPARDGTFKSPGDLPERLLGRRSARERYECRVVMGRTHSSDNSVQYEHIQKDQLTFHDVQASLPLRAGSLGAESDVSSRTQGTFNMRAIENGRKYCCVSLRNF